MGLGFAGTVEVHVNNGGMTDADILKGYRGALYMGIGLSGFGLALAVTFLLKSYLRPGKTAEMLAPDKDGQMPNEAV